MSMVYVYGLCLWYAVLCSTLDFVSLICYSKRNNDVTHISGMIFGFGFVEGPAKPNEFLLNLLCTAIYVLHVAWEA